MGELCTPVPDQFERERPVQPKLVVGDYVEEAGFLVPRRFAGLEEAQYAAGQGTPVLARSEHPDEYSGPSGLAKTVPLELDEASGEFQPYYFPGAKQRVQDKLIRYAITAGLDPDEYADAASLSYWEKIPGTNVTVVADDAVEGRFHIFTAKYETKSWPVATTAAIATEDGQIERKLNHDRHDPSMEPRYQEIIDTYNAIRHLGKFSGVHCPIMELQIDRDGHLYFLQYHRSRDEAFVTDRLDAGDFRPEDGWTAADATRGSYMGSRALNLALRYPNFRYDRSRVKGMELPEDGSTTGNCEYQNVDEYLGRRRIAHVLETTFDRQYESIVDGHGPRSQMFKPQVSVLLGEDYDLCERLGEELHAEGYSKAEAGYIVRVKTDVASDGRTAYVRHHADDLIYVRPEAA